MMLLVLLVLLVPPVPASPADVVLGSVPGSTPVLVALVLPSAAVVV